jgi:hypothetical protein
VGGGKEYQCDDVTGCVCWGYTLMQSFDTLLYSLISRVFNYGLCRLVFLSDLILLATLWP